MKIIYSRDELLSLILRDLNKRFNHRKSFIIKTSIIDVNAKTEIGLGDEGVILEVFVNTDEPKVMDDSEGGE